MNSPTQSFVDRKTSVFSEAKQQGITPGFLEVDRETWKWITKTRCRGGYPYVFCRNGYVRIAGYGQNLPIYPEEVQT